MGGPAPVLLEMTPHQVVEQLETDLYLTSDDLARVLNANVRTVERWRAGQTYPQLEARHRLAALVGLRNHLQEIFATPEAVREWLQTPSRYLGWLSPLDALRAGRVDWVRAALEALDSGIFL